MAGTLTAASTRVTVDSSGTWFAVANVQKASNKNAAGITFLLKYTKGGETYYDCTVSKLFPNSATAMDEYKTPTTIHGAWSQVSGRMSASGNWEIPIPAIPACQVKITFTPNGTPNGTTAIIVDVMYDTEDGK